MSTDEFFGRVISNKLESLQFDLCEVCERKAPNWLEVQNQNDLPLVRFTCNDCHDIYLSNSTSDDQTTRNLQPDENVDEKRPAWIQEFIKEGASTIESIETKSIIETAKDDKADDFNFSEPPDFFKETQIENEPIENDQLQIAVWAPKFIEQALFGPNPEKWLEEQEAFKKDNLPLTIVTLGYFAGNDISSVKLSAIQSLHGVYTRNNALMEDVIQQIKNFQIDSDQAVSDFATEIITKINN